MKLQQKLLKNILQYAHIIQFLRQTCGSSYTVKAVQGYGQDAKDVSEYVDIEAVEDAQNNKVKITITLQENTINACDVTIYRNGTILGGDTYTLDQYASRTYSAEFDYQAPKGTTVTDTNEVIIMEEKTDKTKGYEIEVKSVSAWFTDIKYEGTDTNTNTYYYVMNENEDMEGVISNLGSTEFMEIPGTEENTYTYKNNPEYFQLPKSHGFLNKGEVGLVNSLLGKAINSAGIAYTDIDIQNATLTVKKSNIRKSGNATEQEKSVVTGVAKGKINTRKFMRLLKDSKGEKILYKDVYGGKTAVGDLLVNGDKALFYFLDTAYTENKVCNTIGISTVMRAILQEYTQKDYGITDLTYEVNDNMVNMPTSIIGKDIKEKVWFALKGKGFSDISIAAAMGNIHYESSTFNPLAIESGYDEFSGGIGICQWTNNDRGEEGRNADLRAYAEAKGKTWQDEDIQVEFLVAELTGGGLDGLADNQLFSPAYTKKDYDPYQWKNAKDTEELDEANLKKLVEIFCFCFERPNEEDGLNSIDTRYQYALGYYNQYHNAIGGGEYTKVNSNGILGYFQSGITGRKFTLYKQGHTFKVDGKTFDLKGQCNRAVAASIVSAYKGGKTDMEVVLEVKQAGDYIFTNKKSTKNFFSNYGLEVAMDQYDYSMDNMRTILTRGNYIAVWFKGDVKGKSGDTYSGGKNKIHWIGIIGYKNENGKEQIFISDPGWGSSGWKDIDEFEKVKSKIKHFHTIYEKQ